MATFVEIIKDDGSKLSGKYVSCDNMYITIYEENKNNFISVKRHHIKQISYKNK